MPQRSAGQSIAFLWNISRQFIAWNLYRLACWISPEFKKQVQDDYFAVVREHLMKKGSF